MGNEFTKGLPLLTPMSAAEKALDAHDRRWRRHPNPNEDTFYAYRQFLHNWKHSNSEIQYYMYRFCLGAIIGGTLGLMVVAPFVRNSPYVSRKLL